MALITIYSSLAFLISIIIGILLICIGIKIILKIYHSEFDTVEKTVIFAVLSVICLRIGLGCLAYAATLFIMPILFNAL